MPWVRIVCAEIVWSIAEKACCACAGHTATEAGPIIFRGAVTVDTGASLPTTRSAGAEALVFVCALTCVSASIKIIVVIESSRGIIASRWVPIIIIVMVVMKGSRDWQVQCSRGVIARTIIRIITATIQVCASTRCQHDEAGRIAHRRSDGDYCTTKAAP